MTAYDWSIVAAVTVFAAVCFGLIKWTKWKDRQEFAAVEGELPEQDDYEFTDVLDEGYGVPADDDPAADEPDASADETQRIPAVDVPVSGDLSEHVEDMAGETLFIPELGGLVYGRHSKCRERSRSLLVHGRHHPRFGRVAAYALVLREDTGSSRGRHHLVEVGS